MTTLKQLAHEEAAKVVNATPGIGFKNGELRDRIESAILRCMRAALVEASRRRFSTPTRIRAALKELEP